MKYKEPLYIFFHIPKTAGATFRYHLLKNFSRDEQLEISLNDVGYSIYQLPTKKEKIRPSKKLLKNKNLDRIKIIHGHGVPYGIHKYFANREERYITFMRDPIKRLPSIYNHKMRIYLSNPTEKAALKDLENTLLIKDKPPKFSDWVEFKYNTSPENETLTMFNYLNVFNYRLENFYFVGKTSEYNLDSMYLFDLLGINKFFLDKNISKINYAGKSTKAINEKINKKAMRSRMLYKEAMKMRDKKIHTKSYVETVKLKSIQKKIFLPFTQPIFAPLTTLKYILKPNSINEV